MIHYIANQTSTTFVLECVLELINISTYFQLTPEPTSTIFVLEVRPTIQTEE